jgi:hypothetical protein
MRPQILRTAEKLLIRSLKKMRATNVGAGLPQGSFSDSSREGLLQEIVGSIAVPRAPGDSDEVRGFLFYEAMKFGQHRIPCEQISMCEDTYGVEARAGTCRSFRLVEASAANAAFMRSTSASDISSKSISELRAV